MLTVIVYIYAKNLYYTRHKQLFWV